ncbi:hypothetical protein CALCODRAFT_557411 [Calocera cornea HHB12733]|uniref:Uncharacterized protein n=1 Tax=Calocera cornea HHB12733 TaxID=1353952 RepID=A0A165DVL5_9BASI|nr:hypothetical protein CALCODRAFT_557411 [Calocera cornea HHB12733]
MPLLIFADLASSSISFSTTMAPSSSTSWRRIQTLLCSLYPIYVEARDNPAVGEHVKVQQLKERIDDLLVQQRVLQCSLPGKREVIDLDADEEEQVVFKEEKRPARRRRLLEHDAHLEHSFASFLLSEEGHLNFKTGRRSPNYIRFAELHPERNNVGRRAWYKRSSTRKSRIDRLVRELSLMDGQEAL